MKISRHCLGGCFSEIRRDEKSGKFMSGIEMNAVKEESNPIILFMLSIIGIDAC